MTPKREMIMSKLAGSNACVCALARMKLAGVPSRSARARAAAIIGSEMSMPMQRPFAPSRRATASVVLPVPQPTSSTRPPGSGGNRFDEQVFERLEHLVEQLLRFDPGASGGAVPKRRLLVVGLCA